MYEEAKRFAEAMTTTYQPPSTASTPRSPASSTPTDPACGPTTGRVVSSFMVAALSGRADWRSTATVSQTRSFCYVDDTVGGLLALLDSGVSEPVNIGNPAELSMLDLAVRVLELTGSQSPIVHGQPAPGDPARRCPDTSRAFKLLGWRPEISLTDGLQQTSAWFRSVRSA